MRHRSELAYRRRINAVVAHVHGHLGGDLEGAVLAEVAVMSRYHFHRIFSAMTGLTPTAYVQRARVSAAVQALRSSSMAVGRVALDCGFESGAALAKAMRREYGVSPSGARAALLDPRIGIATGAPTPALTPHRRKTMLNASFQVLPAQRLLCATERGATQGNMTAAAQRAFARLFPAADRLGVTSRMTGCLAVCPDEMKAPDDPDMRLIAALSFAGPDPDVTALPGVQGVPGVTLQTIEAGRWAVFRHVGPYSTLWQTWVAIYRDWVPSAAVTLRDVAPYELYVNDASKVPPEQLITDIHIPVS